jgi:NADH-quinone oxidoreductase subunit C
MKNIDAILKHLQTELHVKYSIKGNINYLKVSRDNYLTVAKYLRKHGFRRLLTVSTVDWIERGNLEVYFLVHKLDGNVYVKVATEIRRDNPLIPSLSELWPNAAMHERETWEIFGIFFERNGILKPLFLEDWNELPPFRKDFDWREYVKKTNNIVKAETK